MGKVICVIIISVFAAIFLSACGGSGTGQIESGQPDKNDLPLQCYSSCNH